MRSLRVLIATCLLGLGLSPAAAAACVLNNTSSLSANGYSAQKNLDASSPAQLAAIPFVFARVYGNDSSIRFAENVNDIRKSLSPSAVAHPFLWRWGDGTYSVAHTPSHTYRRSGTYLISVYAFGTRDGGDAWAPFDRAQIRIVPPGEVWRDNLGADALDISGAIISWSIRIVLGGVTLALAWGFLFEWREARRKRVVAQAPTRTST